jgi:hypothetical protein
VRGFSAPSLLLIDEASRVEDELYKALRPMLAAGDGDLWLMSTPWGKRGFFYETWEYGGDEWMRVRVPGVECPRISKEFLEEERRVQGVWFPQEYLCEFMDNETGMFGRDLVEGALDVNVEWLNYGGLWNND